jgi:hypothetical protein
MRLVALVTSCTFLLCSFAPVEGSAQPSVPVEDRVAEAGSDAASVAADPDALVRAIEAAAVVGTPEGAISIARLLGRGVPPRVAAAGLDALGVLARPEAGPIVGRFLSHRRATLRRHAVAAAQAIVAAQTQRDPTLLAALSARLGDRDERVRIEAATALAEVGGERESTVALIVFERDIEQPHGPQGSPFARELARLLGRAGSVSQVTRLLEFLRRAPLATMADALTLAARRRDLPDPLKLRIVNEVGNLATPGVRAFLSAIADAPREYGVTVSRAARAAADRLPEGG